MPTQVIDATSALLRSLYDGFHGAGPIVLEEVRSRPWTSATFAGARHELCLRVEGENCGEAAADFLAKLDPAAFTLRGHLLAEISLLAEERQSGCVRLRLAAVTLEEA